jgi:hypothetical protein
MIRLFSWLLAVITVISLSACGEKSELRPLHQVGDIVAHPLEWENQNVWLKGKVSQQLAIPFSSVVFYQLDDGTGQIIVQSAHGLPAKDESLLVQGVVHSKLVVGTFSLGMVVVEGNRL